MGLIYFASIFTYYRYLTRDYKQHISVRSYSKVVVKQHDQFIFSFLFSVNVFSVLQMLTSQKTKIITFILGSI